MCKKVYLDERYEETDALRCGGGNAPQDLTRTLPKQIASEFLIWPISFFKKIFFVSCFHVFKQIPLTALTTQATNKRMQYAHAHIHADMFLFVHIFVGASKSTMFLPSQKSKSTHIEHR